MTFMETFVYTSGLNLNQKDRNTFIMK